MCNIKDIWSSDPKQHRLRYSRRFNATGTLGHHHPRTPWRVLGKSGRQQQALSCPPQPVPPSTLSLHISMERGSAPLPFSRLLINLNVENKR